LAEPGSGRDVRAVVGRIYRVFGVRGEVLAGTTSGDANRFSIGMRLYLGETGDESLVVCGLRPHGDGLLMTFEGRPDRTSVEDLTGCWLYLDATALPELPEGTWYHYQLVGLTVTRADGSRLGTVAQVMDLPGQDLYEVRGEGKTWMIPAAREFVAWVDLDKGEIRLTDREDLLEAQ